MARSCTKCGGLVCEEPIPFTGVTAVRCVNCGKCEEFKGRTLEELAMDAVDSKLASEDHVALRARNALIRAKASVTRRRNFRAKRRRVRTRKSV